MNEPTPIADARTIIASDPVFRAVAGFTSVDILTFLGRGNADTSAEQHANARTIVASRTPDPTTLLRLADELTDRARSARCIEDLARALGVDERRAPEWAVLVVEARMLAQEHTRLTKLAASRWQWTVATTPGGGAILSYRAPGHPGFALIASALPRKDGMLAVRIAGQAHTPADDLPAALATIRAILGADVPDIPTPERSES